MMTMTSIILVGGGGGDNGHDDNEHGNDDRQDIADAFIIEVDDKDDSDTEMEAEKTIMATMR